MNRAPSRLLGHSRIRFFRAYSLAALALLVVSSPLAADFEDTFSSGTLGAGWTTWDGYALQYPADTANHATFQPTGSHLSISFPGGAEHNMWWSAQAQVVRPFLGSGTYEIKVDSDLSGFQQFGLIFQKDPSNFIIFMLYANVELRAYIERFTVWGGSQYKSTVGGTALGPVIPDAGPYHVRVILEDNADPAERIWRFEWSQDGISWQPIFSGQFEGVAEFAQIGPINEVGFFAGNQPSGYDAFNAQLDSFRYRQHSPATGLVARAGHQRADLWWDEAPGASTYNVYRSVSGGPYSYAGSTSNLQFSQTGLTNGTTYRYYVSSVFGSTEGPASPPATVVPHAMTEWQGLPQNGLLVALSAAELAHQHTNGASVTEWVSALGAPTIARGVAAQAPTFVSTAINGRPAVRFDGIDDFLKLSNGTHDFTAGMSTFVVLRPLALQSGFKIVAFGNDKGSDTIGLGRLGTTSGYEFFTSGLDGTSTQIQSTDGVVAGESSVISVIQQPGETGETSHVDLAKNGTVLQSGNAFVPAVVNRSSNYIGKSFWQDGRFQGDIAEILVYNRALSPAEQTSVRDYIEAKYGLSQGDNSIEPPATVQALVDDSKVILGWSPVPGAHGYRVYRKLSLAGTFTQIADLTQTSYSDLGLTNGATYHYVVTAYNLAEESIPSTLVSATPEPGLTPDPSLPSSGLILALDAQSLTATLDNGQSVVTWMDASPRRNHATAGAGAPTLVTGALGGKAVVRFDGVNDFLSLPSGFEDFTAGTTLYVVMRPSALQPGFKIVSLGNGAGQQNICVGRSGTTSGFLYLNTDAAGSYSWFGTNSGLVAGSTTALSVVQQPGAANTSTPVEISRNNVPLGGADAYVPPVATRAVNYIGKSFWPDGLFQGDIAEILLYSRALSAGEQSTVREYLQGKYGLNLGGSSLAAPAGLTATGDDGAVHLEWEAAAGASGYRIYRRSTPDGALTALGDTTATTFTDAGLTNGSTYTYVATTLSGPLESAQSDPVSATPIEMPVVDPLVPGSGLVLSLNAEALAATHVNGQSVTTWLDGSPERHHATAGATAPTFVMGAFGGKPVVRFDGVDDHLALASGFESFTGGMTLYVIMKPATLQSGFKLITLGNGSGQQNIGLGRAGTTAGFQVFNTNASGTFSWFDTSDGLVSGEEALISLVQQPGIVGGSSQATVAKNNVPIFGSSLFVPPVATRSTNYIAKSYWGDGLFQGDIAEILLYNRALTATEQSSVRSYVQQKYGLAVANVVLSAPTGLAALADDGAVRLDWNPVTGAATYRVYRRPSSGGSFAQVAEVAGATHLDAAVANGTSYDYVVTACSGTVESPQSAQVSATPFALPTVNPQLPSTGLVLALDAENLTATHVSGQAVTAWLDASPDRNHATAGIGAPTLVTGALGGRAAVRFDGVDDSLNLPAGFDDFTAGTTLYIVMRPIALTPSFKFITLGNGSGLQNIGVGRAGSTAGLQYFNTNSANAFSWFDTSSGLAAGESAVISLVQQPGPADATSAAQLARNTVMLLGSSVYVPPVAVRTVNYIGRSYWGDGLFNGDIAEILLYNRTLTAGEQASVRDYLQAKFGINLGGVVLAAPTGIAAEADDGSVLLAWNAASGATSYRVYRRTTPEGALAQVGDVSGTSFLDSTVTNGSTYYYVVTSRSGTQESAYSEQVSATPMGLPSVDPLVPTSGLILALNAEDLVATLADGQPVTTWLDASPERNHATAGAAAPTLATVAFGGKAVVRFDGVDDHLVLPAGFDDFTAGMTLYLVARPTTLQSGFKFIALGNGAGQQNIGLGRAGSTAGYQVFNTNSSGGFSWFDTSSGLVAAEGSLISLVQQPGTADAASYAELAKNGTPIFGANLFVPPVAPRATNYIGRSYWSDGLFQGDIAEILLFERTLTANEQAAVRTYLAQKYQLAVP